MSSNETLVILQTDPLWQTLEVRNLVLRLTAASAATLLGMIEYVSDVPEGELARQTFGASRLEAVEIEDSATPAVFTYTDVFTLIGTQGEGGVCVPAPGALSRRALNPLVAGVTNRRLTVRPAGVVWSAVTARECQPIESVILPAEVVAAIARGEDVPAAYVYEP